MKPTTSATAQRANAEGVIRPGGRASSATKPTFLRKIALLPRARKIEVCLRFQRDLGCPVPLAKIFRLRRRANQRYDLPVSPERGAARDRHETRGGMRWARGLRKTNASCRVRRSRVVPTPRRWCQALWVKARKATVARKPGRRGEREVSRKTIARGRPECFR